MITKYIKNTEGLERTTILVQAPLKFLGAVQLLYTYLCKSATCLRGLLIVREFHRLVLFCLYRLLVKIRTFAVCIA